jgi:DNA polymerase-3 subunit gamma/tau
MADARAERSPDPQPGADSLLPEPPASPDPASPVKAAADPAAKQATPYRVLARKYRPASFADLIGQEAMVRTLSNAIAGGRLAHAFILTGVRGVGKTTTARIIARALNCIGPDGTGGPTIEPCGLCRHCTSIAQDRDVDVIEMDAASRTGIEDVRSLIEGVGYRPMAARYKVYIIDEVHMLSRQAFNGLLKTLEEPPANVIFIFATTEIRKVPVTVLSRCQRFDLRRVGQEALVRHFARIAAAEGVEAEEAALALIARAADGSVRDGLSLLDQAIALAAAPGTDGDRIAIDAGQVKDMLGLADRTRGLDLFEAVMRGRAAEALAILTEMHDAGADPAVVLQDLLELTHFLTRLKLVPAIADDPATPEAERLRGRALAERLAMPALARAWQLLLKGLGETRNAPLPLQAAEMVLIRLAYASDLPTPGDLVARLTNEAGAAGGAAAAAATAPSAGAAAPSSSAGAAAPSSSALPLGDPPPANQGQAAEPRHAEGALPDPPPDPLPDPLPEPLGGPPVASEPAATDSATPEPAGAAGEAAPPALSPAPQSWLEVVALVRDRRESKLANHLAHDLHLVSFQPGRIEVRQGEHAPHNLTGQLGRLLADWTGRRWIVSVSLEEGEQTLHAQQQAEEARRCEAAMRDPLVQAVLERFPDAKLTARRDAPARAGARGDQEQDDGAQAAGQDGGRRGERQGESNP